MCNKCIYSVSEENLKYRQMLAGMDVTGTAWLGSICFRTILCTLKSQQKTKNHFKKHSASPLFILMSRSHKIVGNVNHACVFNLENCVATNQRDTSTLGNQYHVISLKEPNKACQHAPFVILICI